jgi:trimeric autotransporter adhesin
MSSSGITPINSGPLIIRTYNNGSSNKTYLLGDYDMPISSNHAFITSSNGQLVPSDDIYVSSVSASTMRTSTLFTALLRASTANISTVYASTATMTAVNFSTISGSSIYANTALMVCTMNAPLISTSYLTYSSIVGGTGSNIVVDNIKINASIDATNITLNVGNINFNSISGLQSVTSDIVISNSMSTNQLSTNFLSTNQISTSQINGSAITISSINASTITSSTISVSSMTTSSMSGTIVSGPNGTAVTQIIIGTYTTTEIAANTTANFDQTITGYTSNSIVTMGLRNTGTFNGTCTFVYVSANSIRWIVSNPNATGSIATINYAIFNY